MVLFTIALKFSYIHSVLLDIYMNIVTIFVLLEFSLQSKHLIEGAAIYFNNMIIIIMDPDG